MTCYCADCDHFDLRDRREAVVGLGLCKPEKKPGHYKSAMYLRECERFRQADARTVDERMRLLGE